MDTWKKRTAQAAFLGLLIIIAEMSSTGLIPRPSEILRTFFIQSTNPNILENVFRTFYRVYISTVLALIIGTVIGIADHFSELFSSVVNVIFYPTQFVSEAVLTLIAIALIGINPSVIYIITILAIAPDVFVATQVGLDNIDKGLIELGEVYRSSRLNSLRYLVIPQVLPYIFGGAVRAHATAWDIVATVEVFLALDGLGYLVQNEFRLLNLPELFSLVLIIVVTGLASDYILRRIKSTIDTRYMESKVQGGLID